MRVSLLAASGSCWAHGEEQRRGPADLPRPASIDPSAWRRLSRLARLSAGALSPLLAGVPTLDREEIPLFFGTGLGEFSSSYSFLHSLFTKGPAMASPLAFQNSVHNAAAGHLSIGFGLRGPSETLCAGPLTTLRAFERAMAAVLGSGQPALVLLADDLSAEGLIGFRYAGATGTLGEGAAAFLIGPESPGTAVLTLCSDAQRRSTADLTGDARDPSRPKHVTNLRGSELCGDHPELVASLRDERVTKLRGSELVHGLPEGMFYTADAQGMVTAFNKREALDLDFLGTSEVLRLTVAP